MGFQWEPSASSDTASGRDSGATLASDDRERAVGHAGVPESVASFRVGQGDTSPEGGRSAPEGGDSGHGLGTAGREDAVANTGGGDSAAGSLGPDGLVAETAEASGAVKDDKAESPEAMDKDGGSLQPAGGGTGKSANAPGAKGCKGGRKGGMKGGAGS